MQTNPNQVATVRKPLSSSLRKRLIAYQLLLEADAKIEAGEANETNRGLLNQLFAMAGGVITLSSPIFIDRNVLKSLSPSFRQTLVNAIVLAALSILFGFLQLYMERRFFSKSKNLKFGASRLIGEGYIRSSDELKSLLGTIRPKTIQSTDFFTILQLLCLGVASVEYITVMAHVLHTLN